RHSLISLNLMEIVAHDYKHIADRHRARIAPMRTGRRSGFVSRGALRAFRTRRMAVGARKPDCGV
ncbi:MAG: hypothetical protein P9E24_02755, partial [Candidatus Competibacter sp.]|nr:hypothetical protein [Candidatus Competibacter sp.]